LCWLPLAKVRDLLIFAKHPVASNLSLDDTPTGVNDMVLTEEQIQQRYFRNYSPFYARDEETKFFLVQQWKRMYDPKHTQASAVFLSFIYHLHYNNQDTLVGEDDENIFHEFKGMLSFCYGMNPDIFNYLDQMDQCIQALQNPKIEYIHPKVLGNINPH